MTEVRTPGIVESEAAGEAARRVVEEMAGESRLSLGALPDEAMVALVGDSELAGPLGHWYRGLDPEEKQLAQSAALRTMTTFDTFAVVEEVDDGQNEYEVAPSLLAALHLRGTDASFVGQRITDGGMTWLSYRPAAPGLLLRELVSPQGYHAFLLTRPDEDELAEFLRWAGVEEGSSSSGEVRVVGEDELAGEQGLEFVQGATHVTTLARQLTGGADLSVIHASASLLYIATPGEGAVTYTPAEPAAVHEMWHEWVGSLPAA